jgi:hypothetical protein
MLTRIWQRLHINDTILTFFRSGFKLIFTCQQTEWQENTGYTCGYLVFKKMTGTYARSLDIPGRVG